MCVYANKYVCMHACVYECLYVLIYVGMDGWADAAQLRSTTFTPQRASISDVSSFVRFFGLSMGGEHAKGPSDDHAPSTSTSARRGEATPVTEILGKQPRLGKQKRGDDVTGRAQAEGGGGDAPGKGLDATKLDGLYRQDEGTPCLPEIAKGMALFPLF